MTALYHKNMEVKPNMQMYVGEVQARSDAEQTHE